VPKIKRRIRVVKERCRATRHSLPFERTPKIMTVHIVINVVTLLIFFSTKGGVSETMSHKTIMSGETFDYKKHLSLQIGQYCQVHEEENPRNSQLARTKGAIYLGPSGNLQGDFKFMALNTIIFHNDYAGPYRWKARGNAHLTMIQFWMLCFNTLPINLN
jgi:hypothetical protein